MKNIEKIMLLILVFLTLLLIFVLMTQGEVHYWYVGKQGFGLLFSIGSCVIRLGRTP